MTSNDMLNLQYLSLQHMTVHIIIHSATAIASFVCDFDVTFCIDDCFQSRSAHQSGKSFVESPSWWSLYCFPCFPFSTSFPGMSAQFQSLDAKSETTHAKLTKNCNSPSTHHLDRFQPFACSTHSQYTSVF